MNITCKENDIFFMNILNIYIFIFNSIFLFYFIYLFYILLLLSIF